MAAYNKSEVVLLVAVMACILVATDVEAAISCGAVSSKLAPCFPYLTGSAAAPSSGCCSGANSLYQATKNSRPDRMTACNCIKGVASSVKLDNSKVGSLPGKCGINLGYTPSLNINCATIP